MPGRTSRPLRPVLLSGELLLARGEAGPHSDLDFLVIEPEVEDVIEETYRLRCTLNELDVFAF
jgi:predicted nucleotidyltransferase